MMDNQNTPFSGWRELIVAVLFGGGGVILGAFAAHGLKIQFSEYQLQIWQTGVTYQIYHGLALLGLAALKDRLTQGVSVVFGCWVVGVCLFSGSLYLLAWTEIRWLGMITPLGGGLMILGWFWLGVCAWRVRVAAP